MNDFLNSIGTILQIVSVSTLLLGVIVGLYFKSKYWAFYYLLSMLLFEVGSIFIGLILKESDTSLFLLSFLFHFSFLTCFYFKVFIVHIKYRIITLFIGASLVLLQLIGVLPFMEDSYIRFLFSLSITIYSLIFILQTIDIKSLEMKRHSSLNYSILFFFSIDAFLAVATDFLITESLVLVSWFWYTRAILLLSFYVALVYSLRRIPTSQ